MAVDVAEDQAGFDPVLTVRVQEIRDAHLDGVRAVAGRWEQGLRGLLGLTGVAGVIGAPLAVETLATWTQLLVGLLLALVLTVAGAALLLAMAAAYGSVRVVKPPTSLARLETLRWSLAERGRTQLLWSRRLAVAALGLFAVTIVLAWTDPGVDDAQLHVQTTSGVSYCGPQLNSPRRSIAVLTHQEGRVEIPTAQIAAVSIVDQCATEDK